ncbi:restriction endonuclease subunit S [Myxococcota bacterium]|nr:restriction endonuclease subunit S [Myxococcota bacterium]
MIEGLRAYPAYKDSGVPWLGEVPGHWGVRRAKWLFLKMDRPFRESDEVITCFRDGVVTLRKNRRTRGFTESIKEIGYQGIRRGDLVIHAMDAFAGAVGVSDSDGRGTPVYAVCEPRAGVSGQFFARVVREMARSGWILALSRGIRERSTDFRYESFASQLVPLPPPDEQSAIVRFLDHADRRIRRYVRAKRRLIALLEEEKQAIIHRAVTRGLDPDVKLKPSGVAWVGEVPEDWSVCALRHRYSECLGKMLDSKRILGKHSLPYLRNTDVQWFRINTEDLPVMDIAPDEWERYTVRNGDLLVCEGGEVGRAALWSGHAGVYGFQKALHRLRPLRDEHDVPGFLLYVLCAAAAARAFQDGHESTIAHLTGDKLRAHRFPFPPLREQLAIVKFLERAGEKIDGAVADTHREITLLHEYRTRLVADVVTGKLDVRAAAAALPDEPVDEAPDEPDDLTPDDAEDLGDAPETDAA